MKFDEQIIRDVQLANDIVDVIGQYMPLKRAGRNLKACCPFHQEKTPSFMVNPEKQIFNCFGCGVGGDVFSFLMKYENMTFPEALRVLAERAHITLPEPAKRNGEEGPSESERLYAVYQCAAEYYHAKLFERDGGREAREYWKQRGYGEAEAREFMVGWASEAWQNLLDHLTQKNFPEALLIKSGLIHKSSKGRAYDAFRGRILFPIKNLQGKVVGFGGRLLGEGEGPKYLNSPENPIFRKRRELFGLNLARKFVDRERPQMIVVEGYMDFFRLYSAGFKATVATLGTALTNDHVRVLKRFAEEAIVIYDGDRAGESASLRGMEVFLEEGMNVKLIRMPAGLDPDDFIVQKGAGALRELLESAKDIFDYKLDILLSRHNVKDPMGLMKVTNEILDTLTKVKNPILSSHYVRRLASKLQLDEHSIREELAKLEQKKGGRLVRENTGTAQTAPSPPKPFPKEEVLILVLMLEDDVWKQQALARIKAEDFSHEATREAFVLLAGETTESNVETAGLLVRRMKNEALKAQLAALLTVDESRGNQEQAFEDCLHKMRRQKLEGRLETLKREIAQAERDGDQAKAGACIREFRSLLQQVK